MNYCGHSPLTSYYKIVVTFHYHHQSGEKGQIITTYEKEFALPFVPTRETKIIDGIFTIDLSYPNIDIFYDVDEKMFVIKIQRFGPPDYKTDNPVQAKARGWLISVINPGQNKIHDQSI